MARCAQKASEAAPAGLRMFSILYDASTCKLGSKYLPSCNPNMPKALPYLNKDAAGIAWRRTDLKSGRLYVLLLLIFSFVGCAVILVGK